MFTRLLVLFMQLFVTEYKKNNKSIVIADTELLLQLRKVLRASIGDIIRIQSPENEDKKTRYELRIEVWDNKMVEGTIVSEQMHDISKSKKDMIIAMPNKWDKIELIVQKLTECGVDQILFWPSERSVIKDWNPKKEERLHKIIKEAVEQSRWRHMPNIGFASDITTYLKNTKIIIFDIPGTREKGQGTRDEEQGNVSQVTGIVGPEWGLTHRDYQILEWMEYTLYGLWETVLRTETAAIIWWWIVKNNF